MKVMLLIPAGLFIMFLCGVLAFYIVFNRD